MLEIRDSDLIARGFAARYHRLFVQRWLEQLHHSTMDTYSYKLLNVHTAARELLEVLSSYLGPYHMDGIHLNDVWSEARDYVLSDRVLPRKCNAVKLALTKLLTKCPAPADHHRLRQTRSELAPLVALLDESYFHWLLECVDEDLGNDDIGEAVPSVDALCSELIGRRNTDSLYLLGRNLVEAQGSLNKRWAHFVSVVRRAPQTMVVFLPLSESIAAKLRPHSDRLQLAVSSETSSTPDLCVIPSCAIPPKRRHRC